MCVEDGLEYLPRDKSDTSVEGWMEGTQRPACTYNKNARLVTEGEGGIGDGTVMVQ
jgi:hypothetical protein